MASLGHMAFLHLELHRPGSLKKTRDPVAVGWKPVQMRWGGLAGGWGNGLLRLLPGVTPPYLPAPGAPEGALALWSRRMGSSAWAGPTITKPAQASSTGRKKLRITRRFRFIPHHHKRGVDDLANTECVKPAQDAGLRRASHPEGDRARVRSSVSKSGGFARCWSNPACDARCTSSGKAYPLRATR